MAEQEPEDQHIQVYRSQERCWKCGKGLVELRPSLLGGWRYYCLACRHLTSPQGELEAALGALAGTDAVGITSAVSVDLDIRWEV